MRRISLLVAMACMTSTAWSGTFEDAVKDLKTGRAASAYGRFAAAADAGDPDAARFALLMLRYGPIVWGSYWSASPDEYALWQELSDSGDGRARPRFKSTYALPRGIRCAEQPAVSAPSDC